MSVRNSGYKTEVRICSFHMHMFNCNVYLLFGPVTTTALKLHLQLQAQHGQDKY